MSTQRHDAGVDAAGPATSARPLPRGAAAIADWCVNYLASAMELPPERIQADATFASLGMDSVIRTSFQFALEELLNVPVSSEDLIERPTIAALANHLACHTQTGRAS
jgi:acyl carrier protein